MSEFEWDENKRRINLEKHGLDFADARWVFTDEAYVTPDTRKEYGERRYTLYGPLFGRIVVVTFVVRDDAIRIISMRKANSREQKSYTHKRSGSN